jgi:hypothetical protein
MKVLTVKIKDNGLTYEIHMLNPGEFFPDFGGSRSGLQVRKTASLIVRERSPWGRKDTEYDISDQSMWRWFSNLMQDNPKIEVTAEQETSNKVEGRS